MAAVAQQDQQASRRCIAEIPDIDQALIVTVTGLPASKPIELRGHPTVAPFSLGGANGYQERSGCA
jgi:hypothetical protein